MRYIPYHEVIAQQLFTDDEIEKHSAYSCDICPVGIFKYGDGNEEFVYECTDEEKKREMLNDTMRKDCEKTFHQIFNMDGTRKKR